MPVVLDDDAGERVLLYGADGATLRKVVVDSSGRLVVVGPGASGALTVTATDLDIRNLSKTLDELYAVLRTDAGVAYDARDRNWTLTETVNVQTSGLTDRVRSSDPRERTHTQINLDFIGTGVAPHGSTIRWTYTVPAGRIAIVESLFSQMLRDGATATPSITSIGTFVLPSGGAETIMLRSMTINGVVDARDKMTWSGALWLFAGDRIRSNTLDASTGGTMEYTTAMKATEFVV